MAADWREPYENRGRSLVTEPWRGREDRRLQGGFGEGEFERGGRPFGGYAQGGDDTHMRPESRARAPEPSSSGYGARGEYRRRPSEEGSWRQGAYGGGRRRVQDVMTRHPQVLNPNMSLRNAARRMRADHLGAYPVGEFDRLIGMVTDRDIVVRGVAEDRLPDSTPIRAVLSERVIWCFEDDDVDDVAAVMAEHQVRRIPVLNRDKRLVGMLSLADLGLNEPGPASRALRGVSEPSLRARRM